MPRTVEPFRDPSLSGRVSTWLERWRKRFNETLEPVTATTAQLEDIADAINTGPDKVEGQLVYNTTTNAPVWAGGSDAGDVWRDSAGVTAHTPV